MAKNKNKGGKNRPRPNPRPVGDIGGFVNQGFDYTSPTGFGTKGGAEKKLPAAFKDGSLVGSANQIEDFTGETYSGGGNEIDGGPEVAGGGGGGGGTGSALAGREAVGRVGQVEGQSLEEVVYGVQKKGRKVTRARGE